jgi:hypothetical protein
MQVLRTLFFLLVLGNLLLFVWGQGYFGAAGGSGEAERLAAQIEPDRLRIAGKGVPLPKAAEPPREACRALAGLEREAADKLVELISGRDAQLKIDRRIDDNVATKFETRGTALENGPSTHGTHHANARSRQWL